jgi:ribosomal protein L11 methyltransferase
MRYLRRVYTAPEESREALVSTVWEAGTLGLEEGTELVAWFADAVDVGELPPGVMLRSEQWVAAEDWLAGYRSLAQPMAIGDRLWVDPREPDAPPVAVPPGRIALRIPARTAFGTGSHASTRLVLLLLERLPLAGATVLDVGTGSGILSLAAVALGARRAVGLDLDLAAALLAGQHARLNRGLVDPAAVAFWAGGVETLVPSAGFDLVLANALPHELREGATRLAGALAPAGRLVVSGVPAVDAAVALAGWESLGLRRAAELTEEEWVAWVLARPPLGAPLAADGLGAR